MSGRQISLEVEPAFGLTSLSPLALFPLPVVAKLLQRVAYSYCLQFFIFHLSLSSPPMWLPPPPLHCHCAYNCLVVKGGTIFSLIWVNLLVACDQYISSSQKCSLSFCNSVLLIFHFSKNNFILFHGSSVFITSMIS